MKPTFLLHHDVSFPVALAPLPAPVRARLLQRAGRGMQGTAVELSELRWTWNAEFIPLPADLRELEGSGLKSTHLNSMAVEVQGEGACAFCAMLGFTQHAIGDNMDW